MHIPDLHDTELRQIESLVPLDGAGVLDVERETFDVALCGWSL